MVDCPMTNQVATGNFPGTTIDRESSGKSSGMVLSPARASMMMTAVVVAMSDQIIKFLVLVVVDLDTIQVMELIPGHVRLVMVWNQGINFGLLASESELIRWGLVAVALAVIAWLVRMMWQHNQPVIVGISAGIMCGGAFGNAADRIVHGAVADYLNVTCCGIVNPYAFNFADMAIFTGILGLVLFWDRKR